MCTARVCAGVCAARMCWCVRVRARARVLAQVRHVCSTTSGQPRRRWCARLQHVVLRCNVLFCTVCSNRTMGRGATPSDSTLAAAVTVAAHSPMPHVSLRLRRFALSTAQAQPGARRRAARSQTRVHVHKKSTHARTYTVLTIARISMQHMPCTFSSPQHSHAAHTLQRTRYTMQWTTCATWLLSSGQHKRS